MNDVSKIAIAAVAGAAVGAVAALLLSPGTGEQNRKSLVEGFSSAKKKFNELAKQGEKAVNGLAEKAQNEYERV